MPKPSKGKEICKLLLSQASKTMRETLVQMAIPVLAAHLSGVKFQYPDLIWKELCGQMDNLVAENGGNMGQLSLLVEAICRDFRHHDEAELRHAGLPPHIVRWIVEQFCIDIEALLRLYLIAPRRDKLLDDG